MTGFREAIHGMVRGMNDASEAAAAIPPHPSPR
jgi:hypothetical protein